MNSRDFGFRLAFVIIPVFISLALTAALLIVLGHDPLRVLETTWTGAFQNWARASGVVNFWIPLTLVSIGLVITFTAGLWNIGIEGQMVMGAVFSAWGAFNLDLPQPILIPACLILAATGGAFWAIVAGLLKTRFRVHEIFSGVALNALANTFAIYLIAGPWQPPEGGTAQSTPPIPQAARLPVIGQLPIIEEDFRVSAVMLGITLVALVAVMFILYRTRWGLEMKATGKNPRSALLMGVPTERTALMAFVLCGILAGIAGSHRVLHTYHSLRPLVTGGIGFLGLLVVLLVAFRASLVPFITFALAAVIAGSARVKILMQLDQSLVGVLQGMLVLFILLFAGVRERVRERLTRKETVHE